MYPSGERHALATFSWAVKSGNEYSRIEAVCRQERLNCEYLPVAVEGLIGVFQRDFTVEPMAMMAREGNVQARAQEQGVRVLLSGWGGDAAITCRADTGRGGLRGALAARLPDSLYSRIVADPFMKHASPCICADFARRYRREVAELRSPAMRRLPNIRDSILRLLDIGHLSLRMEDWAASGTRHGLVYCYPMLDKRLVEFALGIATDTQRRALFFEAATDMLPSTEDWGEAKAETATLAALEKVHIAAHSQWADRLASRNGHSAERFVDPQLIQNAVQTAVRTGKMESLRGVREAFGCYAMKSTDPEQS